MGFLQYLSESVNGNMDADEFVQEVKDKGLYGYNVMRHFNERELKTIICDDEYFNSRMKTSNDPSDKLEEAAEVPKWSLIHRLGLKKDEDNGSSGNHSTSSTPDKPTEETDKPKPLTFADRMKAEQERRNKEREERLAREAQIRDEKAKKAEEESKEDKPETTFNGVSSSYMSAKDLKASDKVNDDADKKLTGAMYARRRASTSVDSDGYKRVNNASSISDEKSRERLKKEMDKKFPAKEEPKEDEKKPAQEQPKHSSSRSEYSKRTLLAIADRMDFDVYAKFKKANGDIRTGNFRIGKSESQITQKQNTIICQDLDLSKEEKKVVWRTIPLDRLIEIKPI